MEELYDDIRKQLKAQVSALKYIDSDEGQIDFQEKYFVPSWPAALIDVNSIEWDNHPQVGQTGQVEIQIRIAFRMPDQTSSLKTNIQNAKNRLAIIRAVDMALNNFQGSGAVYSPLFRLRMYRERRSDPLKVFTLYYRSWIEEDQT